VADKYEIKQGSNKCDETKTEIACPARWQFWTNASVRVDEIHMISGRLTAISYEFSNLLCDQLRTQWHQQHTERDECPFLWRNLHREM